MQKRPLSEVSVTYSEMDYLDDFPVSFARHTQRYQSGGSLHFHNGLEIGYCYQGSGLFFVDNNILPFSAGDVSFIFRNQPHIAQSPDENPSYWGFMTVDTERLFCDTEGYQTVALMDSSNRILPGILTRNGNENISLIVRLLFDEMEKKLPNYHQTVKSLLWVLLLTTARLSKAENEKKVSGETGDILRISPSVNFICTHYQEKIPVGNLAAMCNMSCTHFRRIFKQIMGRSPAEYLLEVRMNMAKSMLKTTDMTIADVALSVGFDSLSSFNRHFRKSGVFAPREYRNQYRHSDK